MRMNITLRFVYGALASLSDLQEIVLQKKPGVAQELDAFLHNEGEDGVLDRDYFFQECIVSEEDVVGDITRKLAGNKFPFLGGELGVYHCFDERIDGASFPRFVPLHGMRGSIGPYFVGAGSETFLFDSEADETSVAPYFDLGKMSASFPAKTRAAVGELTRMLGLKEQPKFYLALDVQR
jgi:hypothetical protein